jgi:hypothetical protein
VDQAGAVDLGLFFLSGAIMLILFIYFNEV